jgi:Holliday junction resolvase RusA-like endonuclease
VITYVCEGPQCSTNQGYATAKGRRGMYLTQAGKDFKARLEFAARQAFRRVKPSKGEFEVRVTYYRPTMRGDVDGPGKFVLDSLEGIVYENDVQVTHFLQERKLDRENPRTVISVGEV